MCLRTRAVRRARSVVQGLRTPAGWAVYLPTHRASVARRAQMAKYKFTGALTAADTRTWLLMRP
eukprot:scaffold75817_cov79-Phaeocystis_antarctica.AAC.1